jgi:hypothetical protein
MLQSEIHAKIEYELESSPSKKIASSSILQWEEQPCRKGKNSASVFQRVSSLQESPKKTRMTPKERARKYKKLTAQITKLTQQEYCVVVRKAGSTVEGHTQCSPRRKEGKNVERMLTELTELTVTKTHPICGLW